MKAAIAALMLAAGLVPAAARQQAPPTFIDRFVAAWKTVLEPRETGIASIYDHGDRTAWYCPN
jgi:hypothetical protein